MIPLWQESWPAAAGGDPSIYTNIWRIAPAVRPLKQDVVGEVGDLLWVVMVTIGVVLVIACANVANLLLIRAAARQHELAVRAALGAGVGRLRRAAVLESVAVGLLGGLAGLAIAAASLRALVAIGPEALPRLGEVALDTDVAAMALVAALLAGALVGAVVAARVDSRGCTKGCTPAAERRAAGAVSSGSSIRSSSDRSRSPSLC